MKKVLFVTLLVGLAHVLLNSCNTELDPCACYEKALNEEISEDCKPVVEGMSNDELKQKSNECFESNVEDFSTIK